MSPLACFPCWGPKLWRRGSHASSCSVHCDWTSRPRWRRWSRRKKIGCLGPPAPQRLKREGENPQCLGLENIQSSQEGSYQETHTKKKKRKRGIELKGLTLWMPIAERRRSHVTQANGAFATAVHKHVALVWMTLSSCDYFCQLLHVGRFDVYNIWEKVH